MDHECGHPAEHGYAKTTEFNVVKVKPKKLRKKTPEDTSFVANEILGYLFKENSSLSSYESKKIRSYVNYTSDTKLIAASVLSIPRLKAEVLNQLCKSVGARPNLMTKRLHGTLCTLMTKNREHLERFKVSKVVSEMLTHFPELVLLLVHVMLRGDVLHCQERIEALVPKLSLIYSILMQTRHQELSALQRIVSLFLMDNVVDQKVRNVFSTC